MDDLVLATRLSVIRSRARIDAADVVVLRRDIFADAIVSRAEAEAICELDRICAQTCDAWRAFFVEAVTGFVLHQDIPTGYLSQDTADWLVRAISRDGKVATRTQFELLIRVLEQASSAPETLCACALEQVAQAVVDGVGPLAKGRAVPPGMIEAPEVDLIRRILHAFGGGAAITRAEADILFRINDRTVEEMNDSAWNELFVKAVANHVLAGTGHVVATREEALRRERLFETSDLDLIGFFRRMVAGGASAIFDGIGSDAGMDGAWRARNARHAAAEALAARVDENEANWLADRVGRDRLIRDNERALIAFIAAEAISVPPALAPLVARVA